MNLIQTLEKEQVAKLSAGKEIPDFEPGDTVQVNVKVVEGDRSRIQAYEGVCIGRSGHGVNENFTVRKISYGEGVERVFPLYSPMVDSIKVVRRGKVRRAKLYYLRGRRGKSARKVRAPEKTLAVVDHNVPTTDRKLPNPDPESAEQIKTLAKNAKDFGIEYFDEFDRRQGIVHIIGPEQGFTLPGTTIVCGDSHTATHGAFGALAYGIGTSEVEHVLATQTLIQRKAKNMRAVVDGKLPKGVTAKDIILAIIGEIGTAGGTGHVLEYAGEAIRALSMEGRMTVCNMSIEGGARAGMIAPDEKTFEYLKGRPKAPKGEAWDQAMRYWQTLVTEEGAHFDREVRLDAANLPPIVTW